jgi:hypothetical protein
MVWLKTFFVTLLFLTKIAFHVDSQSPEVAKDVPSQSKRWSNVIMKFNDKIYVKVSVLSLSRDSIEVNSTFVKNSSDRFYFYKPLLPSDDLLKESVFDFEMETGAKNPIVIDFIDSSEGRYYEGTRKIAPCVIPDLKRTIFYR